MLGWSGTSRRLAQPNSRGLVGEREPLQSYLRSIKSLEFQTYFQNRRYLFSHGPKPPQTHNYTTAHDKTFRLVPGLMGFHDAWEHRGCPKVRKSLKFDPPFAVLSAQPLPRDVWDGAGGIAGKIAVTALFGMSGLLAFLQQPVHHSWEEVNM